MEKQLIISVGREYGSGGHAIAEMLSKRFNLPLYDHNLLKKIAAEKSGNYEMMEKYDEMPRSRLFSRTVCGYNNSPEENIARMQFDFYKEKAEQGESFVIIGRCSETLLLGTPGLISIFILGDMEKKIERIVSLNNISDEEAKNIIFTKDKKRKSYHNYYCHGKWGDSRNYDFSINSSRLGIEKTADIIENYIRARIEA